MIVRATRDAFGKYQCLKCEFEIGFHSPQWREEGFLPKDYAAIESLFLNLFGQINQDKCTSQKIQALCQEVTQAIANWQKAYMEEQ